MTQSPSQDESTYVSTAEAAELLGVTVRTFWRYIENGRIREAHKTPGGHRRFNRADVEALKNKNSAGPGTGGRGVLGNGGGLLGFTGAHIKAASPAADHAWTDPAASA